MSEFEKARAKAAIENVDRDSYWRGGQEQFFKRGADWAYQWLLNNFKLGDLHKLQKEKIEALEVENAKLKKVINDVENCLVCAPIADPYELIKTSLEMINNFSKSFLQKQTKLNKCIELLEDLSNLENYRPGPKGVTYNLGKEQYATINKIKKFLKRIKNE